MHAMLKEHGFYILVRFPLWDAYLSPLRFAKIKLLFLVERPWVPQKLRDQ